MKRAVQILVVLTVLALGATCAAAARPPGGGDTGGGTIYFTVSLSRDQVQVWSMNSDGSGKTALPVYLAGEATRQLHGGRRWFALLQRVGAYPDGKDQYELFAVSDAGESVQLTSDQNLKEFERCPVRWAPGDAAVSWVARKVDADGNWIEGGIYSAGISFDPGTGVPSLVTNPTLLVPSEPRSNENWGLVPSIEYHDWSPDGDRIAYTHLVGSTGRLLITLTVIDLSSGESSVLLEDSGNEIEWSPDGNTIAFSSGAGIETISLADGARRLVIAQVFSGQYYSLLVGYPQWSPGSSRIAYWYAKNPLKNGAEYDVHRIAPSGSGDTNLTRDVTQPVCPVAWR
jgi:hypothetical protein